MAYPFFGRPYCLLSTAPVVAQKLKRTLPYPGFLSSTRWGLRFASTIQGLVCPLNNASLFYKAGPWESISNFLEA